MSAPVTADFSGIPGLVMARALLVLPGHDELYTRLLRQFAQSYRAGLPELALAAEAGRWAELARALHGLRGACVTVGAVDLAEHCAALEHPLLALVDGAAATHLAAGLPASVAALQAALAGLVAAIDQRLAAAAAAPTSPDQ